MLFPSTIPDIRKRPKLIISEPRKESPFLFEKNTLELENIDVFIICD